MGDLSVYINPVPASCTSETGIGRVALAQYRYLPEFGFRFIDDPEQADLIACHVNRATNLPRVDVLHLHGLNWSDTPHWPYANWYHNVNRMVIQSLREARAVTVPSEWVAQPLRRDMRLRPVVIGHGIDLDAWKPGDNLHYVLWNKNRNTDVCDPTPAYDLAMHGIDVLSTFAPKGRETTLPPDLRVTGLLAAAKMRTAVSCADVYLATTMETFGIGTLEALACGVPVLGYDWGGTADLVRHGIDGYLVEPGNLIGLLDGLKWIQEHRVELSKNARARAAEFTWPQVIGRYAELYRAVYNERQEEPTGVAVVIPCYNYGKYLPGCVKSLLAQTRPPDEIIIVDDCSPDGSRAAAFEIAKANPIIKVIAHEINQGVAAARNHGIETTRRPLIVCLDADDELAPQYIATVAGEMERDRSLGIAYTGLMLLHENGLQSPADWPPEFDWLSQTTPSVPPSNCIPSAAMFRRAMWERAGGYRQIYAPGEDTEFWTRGLSVGFNCRKVSSAHLFLYRPHAGSASRTKKYTAIDLWHPWMRDKQFPMGAPDQKRPVVRSYALPAVSIVIPVGPGHLRYLPAALDSLLGQTFRGWEVIVIDDTGEDIQAKPELGPYPFPRFLRTDQPGSGAGDARNVGIWAARAPLVLFLDADDYIAPETLAKMLEAYTNAGGRYVYTDWVSLDENGLMTAHQLSEYDPRVWVERLVSGAGGLNAITVLMATADARALMFDEKLPAFEDSDFFARAAVEGIHGKRLPEPLLYYRLSSSTRRAANEEKRAEITRVFTERYGAYLKGEKTMAPCCGGSGNAILAAKRATGQIPAEEVVQTPGPATTVTESATVRMQFVGEQRGPVTYWGSDGRHYRGANSALHRYANVHPADVDRLESTGVWKRIGDATERAVAMDAPANVLSEAERRQQAEQALLAARKQFAEEEPDPAAQAAVLPEAAAIKTPRKRIKLEEKHE